jgi:hypothetical protein
MYGSAGPAQIAEDPRIVVYQSTDREGSTFSLSPAARRMLEARFGERLHASPRIFVAHPAGAPPAVAPPVPSRPAGETPGRWHGRLVQHLVVLLTGLDDQDLAQAGEIELRDPVTDQRL